MLADFITLVKDELLDRISLLIIQELEKYEEENNLDMSSI